MIGPGPVYVSYLLNSSTYLIVHNDKYLEFPFIYVKLYREIRLAVVIDTGCGQDYAKGERGPRKLRKFIEEKVTTQSAEYHFLVICTHCHFDHIGGIVPFASNGATIMASGHDRDFLSPSNLPGNSLCRAFGMPTPRYRITHFLADGEHIAWQGHDLGLQAIHTPGHTPDSLAIYDINGRWLYTGDTCYARLARMPWGEDQDVPIIFPPQGDWHLFRTSLIKLRNFVDEVEGSSGGGKKVRMGCGHTMSNALAGELLTNMSRFADRVEAGKVRVKARLRGDQVAPGGSLGEEMFVFWQDEGETEFGLVAPERFEKEFRLGRVVLSSPGV